jgi:hypothetical protein
MNLSVWDKLLFLSTGVNDLSKMASFASILERFDQGERKNDEIISESIEN